MSAFSRYALLAVLAALALAWPAVAASQPAPSITILSPQELELTGDSVETLTIRNDTPATVGLQFSAEPGEETEADGTTTEGVTTPGGAKVTVLPSTSTALQAHAVGQFDLEISTEKQFDGYLCVGVNGAFQSDQGTGTCIPLDISPTPLWKQPTTIVFEALAAGVIFVLIRWAVARQTRQREKWRLRGLMGAVEWDLSKSFGSAVGLFAAVITAVVETGLLPDTDTPSGVSLLGLSLVFAVLILLAPLTFAVFQRRIIAASPAVAAPPGGAGEKAKNATAAPPPQKHTDETPEEAPSPPEWQPITTEVDLVFQAPKISGTLVSTREDKQPEEEIVGYVLPFLVTSALTIGAVEGQVFTSYLMLEELHDFGALAIGIRLLEVALFPAGLLLGVHFWRTMGWIIEKQHREVKRQYAQAGFPSTLIEENKVSKPLAARPRWTPL